MLSKEFSHVVSLVRAFARPPTKVERTASAPTIAPRIPCSKIPSKNNFVWHKILKNFELKNSRLCRRNQILLMKKKTITCYGTSESHWDGIRKKRNNRQIPILQTPGSIGQWPPHSHLHIEN